MSASYLSSHLGRFLRLTLVLTAVLAAPLLSGSARAQDDSDDQGVSFQTFYDNLGSQGQWIQTDNYGYVFQPTVSDPDWAPYSDGHWVNTDAGWTWVSDEPWGWATYHYGRWANIDGTGWVWVPGNRWAPAWVSWRYGGGYAGWAPLPPESFVGGEYEGGGGLSVGVGFHFGGDVDVNFNIGAGCYNFIGVGDFGENNYRGHYQPRYSNYGIINRTTNITNITVNKTVNNYYGGTTGATGANFRGVRAGGPSLADVNAHSRTRVQTMKLAAATQPGRATVQGNSLAVYAPHVKTSAAGTAKPATVARTISHPTFNRGDSVTKPLEVTQNVKPNAPTPEQIHAAQEAQAHIPAHAKIATEKTVAKSAATMTPIHTGTEASATHANTGSAEKPLAEHTANPSTGEAKTPKAEGETAKPASTHHEETSAATGEPVHHTTTTGGAEKEAVHHTESAPATTYHPAATGGETKEPVHHAASTGATHPQGGASTEHHEAVKPASHPAATTGAKPAATGGAKDDKKKTP